MLILLGKPLISPCCYIVYVMAASLCAKKISRATIFAFAALNNMQHHFLFYFIFFFLRFSGFSKYWILYKSNIFFNVRCISFSGLWKLGKPLISPCCHIVYVLSASLCETWTFHVHQFFAFCRSTYYAASLKNNFFLRFSGFLKYSIVHKSKIFEWSMHRFFGV